MAEDRGFTITTKSQPPLVQIFAKTLWIRRLIKLRLTAGPTRLLMDRPILEQHRLLEVATTFIWVVETRFPRASTLRNSAGRRILCVAGKDTRSDLLYGQLNPTRTATTCENRSTTLGTHSWSKTVHPLATARFWLVCALWHSRNKKPLNKIFVGIYRGE